MIGIWKHGFGCWEEIQSDPTLHLKGKFFLDVDKDRKDQHAPDTPVADEQTAKAEQLAGKRGKKQNAPGPVHLVRRGDYLLLTLLESEAGSKLRKEGATQREKQPGKFAESTGQTRTKKPKPIGPTPSLNSAKASPAPSARDVQRKEKASGNSDARNAHAAKNKAPKKEEVSSSEGSSSDDSDAGGIDTNACKEMLRPVKRDLKELRNSDKLAREDKVKVLSRCLKNIGDRIGHAVLQSPPPKRTKLEKHLWKLASGFWPIEGVQWTQIRAMCKSVCIFPQVGPRANVFPHGYQMIKFQPEQNWPMRSESHQSFCYISCKECVFIPTLIISIQFVNSANPHEERNALPVVVFI